MSLAGSTAAPKSPLSVASAASPNTLTTAPDLYFAHMASVLSPSRSISDGGFNMFGSTGNQGEVLPPKATFGEGTGACISRQPHAASGTEVNCTIVLVASQFGI
jgi:hypothetical protein